MVGFLTATPRGSSCEAHEGEAAPRCRLPRQPRQNKQQVKDIMLLIDPTWHFDVKCIEGVSVDLPLFFAESKVTQDNVRICRSRFDAFCTRGTDAGDEPHLTFAGFHYLNEQYNVCRPSEEEHFFRAMDRRCEYRLSFEDMLLGCAAASPTTPHILNSYTGYMRARFMFDFYNASRSGTLEYEEFARLLVDSRLHSGESKEVRAQKVRHAVQDLGSVSVVTLRVSSLSGHACDIRASTRWTGLRVRREIARFADVPVEVQQLFLGKLLLAEDECLEKVLPEGASSADVSLVRTDLAFWPSTPPAPSWEEVPGIERFVHVTFDRFYKALVAEQLRGTSRLFRLRRCLLHSRPKGARHIGGVRGAVGGA